LAARRRRQVQIASHLGDGLPTVEHQAHRAGLELVGEPTPGPLALLRFVGCHGHRIDLMWVSIKPDQAQASVLLPSIGKASGPDQFPAGGELDEAFEKRSGFSPGQLVVRGAHRTIIARSDLTLHGRRAR
jgi:hypothetical protein